VPYRSARSVLTHPSSHPRDGPPIQLDDTP
jgi:hypothetical protein